MKPIPTQLCLCMLLLSAARLAVLNKKELQQYGANKSEYSAVPHDGSLYGIDSDEGNPGDLIWVPTAISKTRRIC